MIPLFSLLHFLDIYFTSEKNLLTYGICQPLIKKDKAFKQIGSLK